MQRKILVIALAAIALIGMTVSPVTANPFDKPVGEQINLIGGAPGTMDAGEAFHILHGFGLIPADTQAVGQIEFRLEVDGEDQGEGKLLTSGVGLDVAPFQKGEMTRRWLYNFEDGLDAGTYTFTGYWYYPCQAAVDGFGYPGPCAPKNAQVLVLAISLDVTFS